MSLSSVHMTAVGMTIALIGFLVYLNMEQVEEYDFLRQELNAKLSELSCRHKKFEPEHKPSSVYLKDRVKEVVGECIQAIMNEVNEHFFNGGWMLQLGASYQCTPECNCKPICQFENKIRTEKSIRECEKCRRECNKKLRNAHGALATPSKACRYSYTHVNYADSHLGARIFAVQGKPFDCGGIVSCIWGSNFGKNPPENILNSNMEPGCCFAFSGMSSVTIWLSALIQVEVIEIAHIDRCHSPTRDTSSAPKDFTVYGVDGETGRETVIGDFVFENSVPSELYTYNDDTSKFQMIKIEFKTNHGNPSYTCVYKVGVYGKEEE